MKNLNLYLILLLVITACGKSPRQRGEDLGAKLCECMNNSNNENCIQEAKQLMEAESEKLKSSPRDMIELAAGYSQVTQKCAANAIFNSTEGYIPSGYNKQITSVNNTINESFSLAQIELKFYLFAFLLISVSILLSYFGLKYYATGLAFSFVIPILSLLFIIDWYGPVSITTILILGLGLFIFSKPLTYFIGWFWITFFIYLIPALFEPSPDISRYIIYTAMCLSAIAVYFFRKELKRFAIALGASFSCAFGVSMIVSYQSILNGRFMDALMWPSIILLLATTLSFAYQYRYYLFPNQFGDKVTMENNDNELNTNINNTDKNATPDKNKKMLYVGIAIAVSLIGGLVIFLTVNNQEKKLNSEKAVLNQAILDSIEQQRIIDSILNPQDNVVVGESEVESQNENISTQTNEEVPSESGNNYPESTDWCIGKYNAVFNNNPMVITISEIFADGKVTGTCLYKGKTTKLNGKLGEVSVDDEVSGKTVNSVEVILNEPQGKGNGTFKLFFVTPFGHHGTWTSYDGKLTRDVTDIENIED
jgi:hypothetical protein